MIYCLFTDWNECILNFEQDLMLINEFLLLCSFVSYWKNCWTVVVIVDFQSERKKNEIREKGMENNGKGEPDSTFIPPYKSLKNGYVCQTEGQFKFQHQEVERRVDSVLFDDPGSSCDVIYWHAYAPIVYHCTVWKRWVWRPNMTQLSWNSTLIDCQS